MKAVYRCHLKGTKEFIRLRERTEGNTWSEPKTTCKTSEELRTMRLDHKKPKRKSHETRL
jgi:hypothetical protein